jgi:hypothetical protein
VPDKKRLTSTTLLNIVVAEVRGNESAWIRLRREAESLAGNNFSPLFRGLMCVQHLMNGFRHARAVGLVTPRAPLTTGWTSPAQTDQTR